MGFRSGDNAGLDPGGLKVAGLAVSVPQDQLRHRYKADDISASDGDNITTWVDAAGTQDLTAPSGNEPQYVASGIGGVPSVEFDGSNSEYLNHSNNPFSGSDARTMVMVYDSKGVYDGHLGGVAGGSESDNNWFVMQEQDSDFYMNIFGNDFSAGFSYGFPETAMVTYDGSTVETFSGEQGAGATSSISLTTNSNDLVIGARDRSGGVDSHLTGQIAEVLIYTKKLSSDERTQMFDYAKDTYGTH